MDLLAGGQSQTPFGSGYGFEGTAKDSPLLVRHRSGSG